MSKKVANTIAALWTVVVFIYMAVVYQHDEGWINFPDRFFDQFLLGFLILSLPGVVVVLLIYIFTKKRKGLSRSRKRLDAETVKPKAKDERWIFLSYRRADSAHISGRIYDRLVQQFGENSVFKDVDSIPLGVDFRNVIDQMLAQSVVCLAIIGPRWSGDTDIPNQRRIDDPTDFVRIEVASALQRNIPVIPLLVSDAKMPSDEELPDDLKALAYRNGSVIRPDPDFNNDIRRVIASIQRIREQ